MNLSELVLENRAGAARGLPSFCTANDFVLDEILGYAVEHDLPVLIEATCNQVNQDGGYTGLTPADFAHRLRGKAEDARLHSGDLILGGDHLGPNPWRHLPAPEAMDRAKTLVQDYVRAGFTKIHLDASMACGGEPLPSFELVASRAADLCAVAEETAPNPSKLSYVIGTEVPVPGGETDDMTHIAVTLPERLAETVETHWAAFATRGLRHAMERVIAVVVQPGVDFSHSAVIDYDPNKARELVSALGSFPNLGFEAHSTDYQSTKCLSALVRDHSAILKVGPELTFRFREAVMAMDAISAHLPDEENIPLVPVVLAEMTAHPDHWAPYYQGCPATLDYLKLFSLSDRIRYYWDSPAVRDTLKRRLSAWSKRQIPWPLASQYGLAVDGYCVPTGQDILRHPVRDSIARYYSACGWPADGASG